MLVKHGTSIVTASAKALSDFKNPYVTANAAVSSTGALQQILVLVIQE